MSNSTHNSESEAISTARMNVSGEKLELRERLRKLIKNRRRRRRRQESVEKLREYVRLYEEEERAAQEVSSLDTSDEEKKVRELIREDQSESFSTSITADSFYIPDQNGQNIYKIKTLITVS